MESKPSKPLVQDPVLTRAFPPKPPVTEPDLAPPKEASTTGELGEGNYKASKDFNDALKRHLATADTEREARDAAPRSPDEAADIERAEVAGRARSRDNDPPV